MAVALMILFQDGLSSYFTISFTAFECLVDKAGKWSRVAMLRYRSSIDVCSLTTKLKVPVINNIIITKDKHSKLCCYSNTISSLEQFHSYSQSNNFNIYLIMLLLRRKPWFRILCISLKTKTWQCNDKNKINIEDLTKHFIYLLNMCKCLVSNLLR